MPDMMKLDDAIKDLYGVLDEIAAVRAAHAKITCSKGCWSCCMLLTSIGPGEGIYIATRLLESDRWKEYLPRLADGAKAVCYEGINNGNYFMKKIRCPFLGKDNSCEIYEHRPHVCRYHMVSSHPDRCSPEMIDRTKAVIDTQDLEKEVWRLEAAVCKEMGMGLKTADFLNLPQEVQDTLSLVMAPIPLMVIHCMDIITRSESKVNRIVREYTKDIMNPVAWMKMSVESMIKEIDERPSFIGTKMSEEEAEKMREKPT